jgi:Tol biopolymer transport system component
MPRPDHVTRVIHLLSVLVTLLALGPLLLAAPPGGQGGRGGGGGGGGGGEPPADPAIAYLDRGDIFVLDADGANATRVLRAKPDSVEYASWSPDGSQIVFASILDGVSGIYVMSADGSSVSLVVETTIIGGITSPVWSPVAPDGRSRIVFHDDGQVDGEYDLFIVDPDGSDLVNLTATPDVTERNPTWSFDGSFIAAVRAPNDLVVYELAVVDGVVAIVGETVIFSPTIGPGLENMIWELAWANTSDTIAFSIATAAGDSDLMMIDLVSGAITPLTDTPTTVERYPSFSPDDFALVFARWYSDEGIHVMDTSTGLTTLINDGGSHPSWRRY